MEERKLTMLERAADELCARLTKIEPARCRWEGCDELAVGPSHELCRRHDEGCDRLLAALRELQ